MAAKRGVNEIVIAGRYRLLEPLGEGGMSQVFRAEDLSERRQVAVKLLRPGCAEDPAALERFHQEARLLRSLSHPNVVAVLDQGQQDHLHYLVLELAEGVSLQQLIWEEGPLPVDRALDLGIQIASAVGAAHREGIIHRDLKPSNVIVSRGGQAKVADFGIARSLSGPPVTDEGMVWGTASYLAPEQVMGERIRFSADVYAIGALLYEMLTGCPPYQEPDASTDPRRILRRKLEEDPAPVRKLSPQVPPQIARIVAGAMARDPSRRFRTARQVEAILRGYRDRGTAATRLYRVRDVAQKARRESPAYWLAVALLGLILLAAIPAGAFIFLRYRGGGVSSTPTTAASEAAPPADQAAPLALVPRLVGMGQEEARRAAARAGLKFVIVSEQYVEGVAPLTVVTQTLQAGQSAQPGSSLGVILSRGSQFLSVPGAAGRPVDEVREELEAMGLLVEVEPVWSTEHPRDVVMEQSPGPDSVALKGSTVRLVVSSGPRISLDAQFGDAAMLRACELSGDAYRGGDPLVLTLYWEALKDIDEDYTVFVHLIYGEDFVLTQHDAPPADGAEPTSAWEVGEEVLDVHELVVPPGAAPGLYWIEVGLYHQPTMMRLEALDSASVPVTEDGAVRVRRIEVRL